MQHNSDYFHAVRQGDVAVLTLVNPASPLTATRAASDQLRSDLTNLLDSHQPAKILVDFAGLRKIGPIDLGNAAMIAILLAAKKQTAAYSSQWRLCGMSEDVQQRYVLARLDKIFPMHPTQSDALAAFQEV